jgi:hypothetical protein
VRDGLQTSAARIPRPDELAWRSMAANRFAEQVEGVRDHLASAVSILDAVAAALQATAAERDAGMLPPPVAAGEASRER